MNEISVADRLALHELAARYGNTLDDRQWDRFETCFTADCLYELRGFGRMDQVIRSASALRLFMEQSTAHPVAHHVTNVEILVGEVEIQMLSKIIGSLPGGLVGSGDYRDIVTRQDGEWRIAHRVVSLRRPPR